MQRDNKFGPTFAIIGYGFIADRHLAAIENMGGVLMAVVECDEGKKFKVDDSTPFFTNIVDFYESPIFSAVDYIVICTPNHLHADFIKWALRNEKNVLCEKPITLSYESLQELIEHESRGDAKVNIVMQLRASPILQRMREELNGNDGNLIELDLKMHRSDFYWKGWKGDPEKSGGILFNIGIHYFDLLCWFFGEPIDYEAEEMGDRKASGTIRFKKAFCKWSIDLTAQKENQRRSLIFNGKMINLTRILESLHNKVYEELKEGKGTTLHDVKTVINLCEQLTESYGG
jgi:UDP-N-acetyl-2-amino-2-deoxyglucuronate dehydrogenase